LQSCKIKSARTNEKQAARPVGERRDQTAAADEPKSSEKIDQQPSRATLACSEIHERSSGKTEASLTTAKNEERPGANS
jgi:hypothetical protein